MPPLSDVQCSPQYHKALHKEAIDSGTISDALERCPSGASRVGQEGKPPQPSQLRRAAASCGRASEGQQKVHADTKAERLLVERLDRYVHNHPRQQFHGRLHPERPRRHVHKPYPETKEGNAS